MRARTSSASARCCTRCCRARGRSADDTVRKSCSAVLRDEPPPLAGAARTRAHRPPVSAKTAGRRFQTMGDVKAALEAAARERTAPSEEPQPSIAVLPFANMSADPDNEYFSDGLAEEIINALAHDSRPQGHRAHVRVRVQGQEQGHPADRAKRSASRTCSKAASARPATASASPRS